MRSDLASKIGVYAEMAQNLSLYDDDTELTAFLVRRDSIHDRLRAGEVLSLDSAMLLNQADRHLLEESDLLVRRFPRLFAESSTISREYWWWHLNEAEVHEQARADARRTREPLARRDS